MPKIPWFEDDYHAIAKLAMEHFTATVFKRFAFCGIKKYQWAQWLREHFSRIVHEAGFPCSVFEPKSRSALGNELELREITRWVKRLPKPIALLACNDFAGRKVLEACIREHACEGINVKDVLKAHPQSRRLLESKFKKHLGHSPHEEILNVQMARVKLLLVETDHSMESIAERTGFNYVEYLSVVFNRVFGMPPSEYRKLNRR